MMPSFQAVPRPALILGFGDYYLGYLPAGR